MCGRYDLNSPPVKLKTRFQADFGRIAQESSPRYIPADGFYEWKRSASGKQPLLCERRAANCDRRSHATG